MNFYGHKLLTIATFIALFIGLIIAGLTPDHHMPEIAKHFMLAWLAASVIFSIWSYWEFTCGFLLAIFSSMIGWRIAAIYNLTDVSWICLFAFILMFINFIYCAKQNLSHPEKYLHAVSLAGWQLVFIRLYIGLDFVPHFTEKLFAGSAPHMADVNAFISLGVPHADLFVWLAGLCEFGAAAALCLGILARLGAIGAILYLLVATFLGHHFSLGFIWAGPGGGWEFAVLWIVLISSYAITGLHKFSLDQRIEDHFNVPNIIKKWM